MSIEELMKTFYSQPPGDEDNGAEDVEEGDDAKEENESEEKETPDDSAAQSSGMQEMFWPELWLEFMPIKLFCNVAELQLKTRHIIMTVATSFAPQPTLLTRMTRMATTGAAMKKVRARKEKRRTRGRT